MSTCTIRFIKAEMASSEGNTPTYKMTSLDPEINQHFQDAIDVIQQHSHNAYYTPECKYFETLSSQPSSLQVQMSYHVFAHQSDIPAVGYDWSETTQHSWPQVMPPDVSLSHSVQNDSPHFYPIIPPQRNSKGRKKLRLYEYLHEALNDPSMGDSIQWTDSSNGTFHFISKNKEKLAECWGQRKGNRKTMTYQKMARALRNYSRTGEIVKVRRKLTYQFNPDILHRLGSAQVPMHLQAPSAQDDAHSRQESPSEQSYPGSAADWHSWYAHYQLQEDYDLAASFTSHSSAKL